MFAAHKNLILILGLCLSPLGQGQTTYQQTGLTNHNTYRKKHGAVAMTLDTSLSTIAQNCSIYYATRKTIDHTCTTSGAGENLYMSWGSTTPPDPSTAATAAINMWYAENTGYNYANPGSSTGVTGHFTQLVWNASTVLGIGVGTVGTYTVVVGKYKPAGNVYWSGTDQYIKFKQNVFPPIAKRDFRSPRVLPDDDSSYLFSSENVLIA